MEPPNPTPLYTAQGSPSPYRATIPGSYPIRAPPSFDDSELLHKKITQNHADSSNSSIKTSVDGSHDSENESFVSGEDDFETASERPFVTDTDEDNLELYMDIDEPVPFVKNTGNSDVGFSQNFELAMEVDDPEVYRVSPGVGSEQVVPIPIAPLSGDDDEVGDQGLSETDDLGIVRVRVSGIRGKEGFDLVGSNSNEEILIENPKPDDGGNPRFGESPLVESNVGDSEEQNGILGNRESEFGKQPVEDSVVPITESEFVGSESVENGFSGVVGLPVEEIREEERSGCVGKTPKADESGNPKLGESSLSAMVNSELMESDVGDAEEKNGVLGIENIQKPESGTARVDVESESVGSESAVDGFSGVVRVPVAKIGAEGEFANVDAKSGREEISPEIPTTDESGDPIQSEIQDSESIKWNVGDAEEENGGLGSEHDRSSQSGKDPVDRNVEVRSNSVVGIPESGSIGLEMEAGVALVEENGSEISVDSKILGEDILPENRKTDERENPNSGESPVLDIQDLELIESNVGGAEKENRVLGNSMGTELGVVEVEKDGVSSNGSDVNPRDGTELVRETQATEVVEPVTIVEEIEKSEVLGHGPDQYLEPQFDAAVEISVAEIAKDGVTGSNPEQSVEGNPTNEALESEFCEEKDGFTGFEKDEAPPLTAVDSVIDGSAEKVDDNDDANESEIDDGGFALNLDVNDKQPMLEAKPILHDSDAKSNDSILRLAANGDNSNSSSSHDYLQRIDAQIITDSDDEVETDEEGGGKELFDSTALAALLEAASGAAPGGSIRINSQETAARLFSSDRPAGLGSSIPSLKPANRPNRPNIFTPSDLAVFGESDNNTLNDEEKKMQDKIQAIRVKFLRLVQRLGHSPEDTVAAQVLYRLGLAEGLRRGRQASQAFSLDSARKTAMQLEMASKDDLDFSCNILVLGKSGMGKSATINSIFGEEKTRTDAFRPATSTVREIIGFVDGVKIRVIDTPGLRPSVMDQTANRKILASIKKFTKKCPPDIILYVDRLDTQTRDFNDLPLLKTITSTLGSSVWFNAIVALSHAASAPPDGANGSPLSYEVFVAQRSHVVQHSIRQAAGDMRLMNPVALVENHPSCRRNREGQRVLPNGQTWRPQLLLLCYSSKILSEANSLLKLQDPSPGKLFGLHFRSPPLPFLLSSLLQSRPHPKLSTDQGLENGDSDFDLGDLSDSDQEEEDEYDQLPPFKPLRKAQIAMLSKEQRKAYFDEYDYRVKLLQKKQWREELRRMRENQKRAGEGRDPAGYGDPSEEFDQENGNPAAVPVPMPDMVLPPSFDGDNPAYRYRFLEPTSQLLARPVLDTHGWDHDCGYDGVNLEENLSIANRFPAGISVQITKDKKEFNIHLDSSVSAKHGENGSTLAGFDIQTVGKQLAYILRTETKIKNLKKNKTVGGVTVTFLGETVATGLKLEDQLTISKRFSLVASTGAVRAQSDVAYGANLEARIREKDYPIGQDQSTLGLSLMRWRGDLAVGANLQSQFSMGRSSKMAVRVGLNNKLSGQITLRASSSEQLQMALVGILPIAISVLRSIWPGESYFAR